MTIQAFWRTAINGMNAKKLRSCPLWTIPAPHRTLTAMPSPWDQYGDYLALDSLLGAQAPRSHAAGAPAHDEMLFIVYHQVCELWFRQILFELDDIDRRFSRDIVDDRDMQPILAQIDRVTGILRLVVNQTDILETMTPQSFIDFREHLSSASGFQSLQFRLIETRLGLRRDERIPVFHGSFDAQLSERSRKSIEDAESRPSLFELLDGWLSRTPFTTLGEYRFQDAYKKAVHAILDAKADAARTMLDGRPQELELAAIERGREKFEGIFDATRHTEATQKGLWRLSLKALQAALFITLYRNEPMLQAPYALLNHIMNIDEQLALWRVRHALMVQRMVGGSAGTGGSSGFDYLMETIRKHRIFNDLFALSAYLIPSGSLPPLPEGVAHAMGYRYST
jgi:tryptophan 2,3-dioxygenase